MNIHENNTDDILVIGSGVIGLFCAYTLQKNGFQVTIFDKYEPGLQCSFGNAGAITPEYALPNAAPGVFKNIPKFFIIGCSRQHKGQAYGILNIKTELINSKIQQLSLELHRTRQISTRLPNQVDKLKVHQRERMLS